MPGPLERVIILLIVLLIFGAGKLPAIGDALGRSIKNFRRSSTGVDEIDVSEKKEIPAAMQSELHGGETDKGVGAAYDEAEVLSRNSDD